ncbi:MaoC/PaaZ C-terminal domain-containing protein [Dokdonella sp.]|uniref:MaoC/PaaZ C-terminal domain-containing protein n=1 Tax=Dokdonella sp. TaxID=2291710 RepID=UPI003526E6D0
MVLMSGRLIHASRPTSAVIPVFARTWTALKIEVIPMSAQNHQRTGRPRHGKEIAVKNGCLSTRRASIQAFADATDDHQRIHLDVERCRRESSYRHRIAHGHLVLSMLPAMFESSVRIDGLSMSINYGLDRVRLPAPGDLGSVSAAALCWKLDPVAGGM